MDLPKYPDLVKTLIKNLRKLSTRMVLFQQNAAHSLGVIHTDFKTADILNENGPLTAGELAKVTGLSTGSVTALIDRLEHAGYVRREKDPNDRRRVIIIPVKEKQSGIKEYYLPLSHAMTQLCSRYNEDEMSLIIDFIERTIEIHETEIKRSNSVEPE
ncbi:MarR family transcriptional regulator [Neobacillus sp. PS3-40]|uniref:MarR family transcriptional regulator n=1 Tax=Neobacillus sp. PS3-40 TaxID=3070679 RepID=UPI0027E17E28|nr:MarR family transcriptional regulator [Neobacillus sp. PS3-40]WML45846.1 MarR family transcriptional regulator [Neobacillus sp. PS3-40]